MGRKHNFLGTRGIVLFSLAGTHIIYATHPTHSKRELCYEMNEYKEYISEHRNILCSCFSRFYFLCMDLYLPTGRKYQHFVGATGVPGCFTYTHTAMRAKMNVSWCFLLFKNIFSIEITCFRC